MFERDHLEALLDLQRRTYALLRWVSSRVRDGTLRLGELHGALDAPRAAAEWVARHAATFPADARPPDGAVERFAHLFASYLVTSFEVAAQRKVRAACGCELCSYLVNAPHLRARTPSDRDRAIAREVKLDYLDALAAEVGAPLFRDELAALLGASPELARPLALVTWVRELERRAAYRGQGGPVLALWRELAWTGGRPDRRFEPTADAALAAEAALRDALRAEG